MSFLDRIFGRAPRTQGMGGKPGPFGRIWSQAPRTETTKLPDLYHKTPRLDSVALIASAIADTELQLFDEAKYKADPENAIAVKAHPFYELMDFPSRMFPEIDGHQLRALTVTLVELLGEFFWIKVRDTESGPVKELLPFPPAWCILTPTQGNPVFMFQPFGTTSGKTITVPPEDVVWFKQLDTTDPFGRGRGRTEAIGGELDADEMAQRWQTNMYYNDGTPPFWANIPGAAQADLERLRDTWGQRLGGWLNARKPAFTNQEGVQITKLGDTPKEMDFVESRRYLRDIFIQHYSIPPELFGILESSNRSTIDAADYLFSKNVIKRRLGFYERVITRQLVKPDFDARLMLKFDFEIPEDEAFRLQKVNEGLARGALTRADWKRAMGYKVDASDEVYLVPISLIEVPKGQSLNDSKPEPIDPTESEPVIDIADDDEDEPEAVKAVKAVDARKAAHWKAADNRAKQGEGMFRTRTRAFADTQSERVKKAIKAKSPTDYKAAIDEAFNGADAALMHALAPAWMASMTDGAEIGRAYLGLKVSPSFALYNQAFDKWVKSYGLIKAKEINETSKEWLLKYLQVELSEGIAAGESIESMTARLLDAVDGVYENMSAARAETIARTETMASVSFGQQVVYKAEGVERKEWLATPDSATRDAHAEADGQQVDIDSAFHVGGESLMYPADPSGSAENTINCRCTILPIVEL